MSSRLQKPLKETPGMQFFYCTLTTHILSALLSNLTNVPLSYFAQKMLFHPLGISSPIYWEADPQGINWGGSNMFLTPLMLARFSQLYMADGVWSGQRILPKGWVTESFTPQVKGWDNYADYGYLWWTAKHKGIDYAFASGYGGQYVYVIPDLKTSIVFTANSDISIQEMQSTNNIVIKDPSWLLDHFIL